MDLAVISLFSVEFSQTIKTNLKFSPLSHRIATEPSSPPPTAPTPRSSRCTAPSSYPDAINSFRRHQHTEVLVSSHTQELRSWSTSRLSRPPISTPPTLRLQSFIASRLPRPPIPTPSTPCSAGFVCCCVSCNLPSRRNCPVLPPRRHQHSAVLVLSAAVWAAIFHHIATASSSHPNATNTL